MPGIEEFEGAEWARISVELPIAHVGTAAMMLNGIKGRHNLEVTPLLAVSPYFPVLYSRIEDEHARMIPAVQRPHIKEFARYIGWDLRLASRLMSGVWGATSINLESGQWKRFSSTIISSRIIGDLVERPIAIKAQELPRLHKLLQSKHPNQRVDLDGVGPKTIQFAALLSAAVSQSLALYG